jgi:hypothetical protein
MTELVGLLVILLGVAVPLFGAYWVWQDAHRLKTNGADITPGLWAILVLFLWLVSLPLYLYLRRTIWRTSMSPPPATEMAAQAASQHQLSRPSKTELRVLYWVISVVFAVMLSMYATWVAISRYPIPDSNAINLGLFLFFLIELLSLLAMGDLLVRGIREGIGIEIGKLSVILVGGFLGAVVVGLCTWGIGLFVADKPWVPRAFGIALTIVSALQALQSWWLRRKSRLH